MERLLLAFVLIGTTLACSPVPEPKKQGNGHDIVHVFLITNQTYNAAGISRFLDAFSQTKIQQYSASVGDFSDLNCTNTDGYFTWTFTLTNANCSIVRAWIKQIVASSSFYKNGYATCVSEIAFVTLVTYSPWDPSQNSEYLDLFNKSDIQPYSASLGDFSDLNYTYVDGFFAFTFKYTNANCSNVWAWVNQIPATSQYYVFGNVRCDYAWKGAWGHDILIEITTTPPPPPTTTTAQLQQQQERQSRAAALLSAQYVAEYEEPAVLVQNGRPYSGPSV